MRWCRRGLSYVPNDLKKQSGFDMRLYLPDRMRMMLGQSLIELNEASTGVAALQRIQHHYLLKDAQSLIRRTTGTTAPAIIPTNYVSGNATWSDFKPNLPGKFVSDIEWDGHHVWIAVKHHYSSRFANDSNIHILENAPARLTEALKIGGLARIDPRTRESRIYRSGEELSDSWVTCVKAVSDGMKVGQTYRFEIPSFSTIFFISTLKSFSSFFQLKSYNSLRPRSMVGLKARWTKSKASRSQTINLGNFKPLISPRFRAVSHKGRWSSALGRHIQQRSRHLRPGNWALDELIGGGWLPSRTYRRSVPINLCLQKVCPDKSMLSYSIGIPMPMFTGEYFKIQ